jgi:hypothetical protein
MVVDEAVVERYVSGEDLEDLAFDLLAEVGYGPWELHSDLGCWS